MSPILNNHWRIAPPERITNCAHIRPALPDSGLYAEYVLSRLYPNQRSIWDPSSVGFFEKSGFQRPGSRSACQTNVHAIPHVLRISQEGVQFSQHRLDEGVRTGSQRRKLDSRVFFK
jgi:hypothetical protein